MTDVRPRRRAARCPLGGVLLSGIVLVLSSLPARGEWILDAETSAFYDSNLSRASVAAVVRPGAAANLMAGARWFEASSAFDAWTIGATVAGEAYGRYRGLDSGSATGAVSYRHKAGLGITAPWFLCEATAGYSSYDVDVRTGARFALRAEAGKRYSERADAAIGVFYDRRYGPYGQPDVPGISGKVFDLRGGGAYVRGAYAITHDLLVSVKFALRRGDVVSTSSENPQVVSAATAIAEDPTFGADLYDYRLKGTTRAAALAMNWALDERSSLALAWAGESTAASGGLDYRSNAVSVIYSYRY